MLAFLSLVEQQLGHQGQLNPLLLAPLLPSMRKLLALSRNGDSAYAPFAYFVPTPCSDASFLGSLAFALASVGPTGSNAYIWWYI
jgi:hypothetical protein